MRKLAITFFTFALALGGAMATVATAQPAQAAGGCSITPITINSTKTQIKVNSCSAGVKARAYLKYFVSDNDPRVRTIYGTLVSSGYSTASKPTTAIYYMGGAETKAVGIGA